MLSNLASTILRTQTSEENVCRPTPHIILLVNMYLLLENYLPIGCCGDANVRAMLFTLASVRV
jgi:hypothetical protein